MLAISTIGAGAHHVSCKTFREPFPTLDDERAAVGIVAVEDSTASA